LKAAFELQYRNQPIFGDSAAPDEIAIINFVVILFSTKKSNISLLAKTFILKISFKSSYFILLIFLISPNIPAF